MRTTTVVNIHDKQPHDIYIGRPGIWGNPYVIGRDGTREEVIKKYEDQLLRNSTEHLVEFLVPLVGKRLGCFCKPLACHEDVLVELIKQLKLE